MTTAKRPSKTSHPAASVDAYLAALPPDVRAALTKLRKTIQAAAPGATEHISYQIPIFKLKRMLVGFAAAKEHCTFHLLSTAFMRTHAAELVGYPIGKGSIRFTVDQPLPAALVTKLVKARMAEIEEQAKPKATAKPKRPKPRSGGVMGR